MAQAKGYGQPNAYNAPLATDTFVFKDDGLVPRRNLDDQPAGWAAPVRRRGPFEASPGPKDSHYLFERFVKLIEENKARGQASNGPRRRTGAAHPAG